jgi:hypothetical protein
VVIGALLTAVGLFMRRGENQTAEVDKLGARIEKQIERVVMLLDLVRDEISKIKRNCANHPGVNKRLDGLENNVDKMDAHLEKQIEKVMGELRPVGEEIGKIRQDCIIHSGINRRLDEVGATATRLAEVEKRLAIVEAYQRPSIVVPRSGG